MKPYEKDKLIEYYIGISDRLDQKLDALMVDCAKNKSDIKWIIRIGGGIGSIFVGVSVCLITGLI